MAQPSPEFLCVCIASALLDHAHVERPPVPIREILRRPPPDLSLDLGLTESLPFGDAMWVRTLSGIGSVFANPAVPEPQRRLAMARALFTGLCSSELGHTAGLPSPSDDRFQSLSQYFARCLLMPEHLLPDDWEALPPEQLAVQFVVPAEFARERMDELRRNGQPAADAQPNDD